ncbi:UDP-N-acetylmuramoyl-tripeptide--D-alanyl-D-alanine ligase [Acidithiobacillus thiooxidans]|uniref:UDP-N-acetylmuramoyl-tripeptide--D-alanyl-D- alanine ligase n=1 Tax=Acidithiobacillus thiooxidans TaxID=930 RepID=UPI000A8BCCBC|nr:UDP-N-acetylmuramoyl-tripeptide--D-alanyl-D-alanine ligase [Acidithiobacillus thiooxidans]
MMRYSLNEIARITGGQLLPGSQGKDEIHGIATDSRQPMIGKLFVALTGEHFDGNDFVPAALAQGAAAVLSNRQVDAPGVVVKDTLQSLQSLAQHWRQRFNIPVLAVTGSCGKTTVKEVLTAILAESGPVLATQGNQNNHIGVPLTLARLGVEHRYAVLEMGMNHPGELTLLSALAKPTLALINNAGPAHLAGLGTVAAVAAAKGEILSGLDNRGISILNGDDQFADFWAEKAPGEVWRFSLNNLPVRVRGHWQDRSGSSGQLDVRAPRANSPSKSRSRENIMVPMSWLPSPPHWPWISASLRFSVLWPRWKPSPGACNGATEGAAAGFWMTPTTPIQLH